MINDLSDLQKLLKLCRKQGVLEIEVAGVKLKLGDLPTETMQSAQAEQTDSLTDNPYANFPNRILTNDELALWSAGVVPEPDEEAKAQ